MTRLLVRDRGRPRTPRAFLRRVVAAALRHAGQPELPVSLLLTDDAGIARIHGEFLGDPAPTDVIAFRLDGAGPREPHGARLGAEVVVSVETAARCARAARTRVRDEVALYVVHGLLHCCGYDDVRARDRRSMRAAERAVLAALGLHVHAVDDDS